VIRDDAIESAVSASRWFLRHRHLPDRAIDLIDEAGARVKLRSQGESPEAVEIGKRIRRIVRRMENSIANHEFDKARQYSDEERQQRQELERLRTERQQQPVSNILTPEDIVEALAARVAAPVSMVKSILAARAVDQLEPMAKELASRTTLGPEWADDLIAYLTGCTAEEADSLAQAIRTAKTKIDLNR
jgi:ATP-dependent Clp protease ATP-binding subunit ClpC